MRERLHRIIRSHCRPLEPLATGQQPVLSRLSGVRAVLFDVYGTLLVSASGEVGSEPGQMRQEACAAAFAATGLPSECGREGGAACFERMIKAEHEKARRRGIEHPEVDIVEIWGLVLAQLHTRGRLTDEPVDVDLEQLALEYEVRANPVWPMPGSTDCLERLRRADLVLGIISNAQFFTIELFPALLDQTVDALGFDPELQYYSYEHGHAKPGLYLFDLARRALAERGIAAEQTLYVGNDMLNDVLPAGEVGFHTGLFAGDARSLRLREGDQRVSGVVPDLVLTDLDSLGQCLSPA